MREDIFILTPKIVHFLPECEPLNNPFGGSVSLPAGRTIGSTATFTCKPGFEMSGPATLTCSVDGRWSDDPPVCISLGK